MDENCKEAVLQNNGIVNNELINDEVTKLLNQFISEIDKEYSRGYFAKIFSKQKYYNSLSKFKPLFEEMEVSFETLDKLLNTITIIEIQLRRLKNISKNSWYELIKISDLLLLSTNLNYKLTAQLINSISSETNDAFKKLGVIAENVGKFINVK